MLQYYGEQDEKFWKKMYAQNFGEYKYKTNSALRNYMNRFTDAEEPIYGYPYMWYITKDPDLKRSLKNDMSHFFISRIAKKSVQIIKKSINKFLLINPSEEELKTYIKALLKIGVTKENFIAAIFRSNVTFEQYLVFFENIPIEYKEVNLIKIIPGYIDRDILKHIIESRPDLLSNIIGIFTHKWAVNSQDERIKDNIRYLRDYRITKESENL